MLQVKSYLTGNPAIAIALNDSLTIGRREGGQNDYGGYGRYATPAASCKQVPKAMPVLVPGQDVHTAPCAEAAEVPACTSEDRQILLHPAVKA